MPDDRVIHKDKLSAIKNTKTDQTIKTGNSFFPKYLRRPES